MLAIVTQLIGTKLNEARQLQALLASTTTTTQVCETSVVGPGSVHGVNFTLVNAAVACPYLYQVGSGSGSGPEGDDGMYLIVQEGSHLHITREGSIPWIHNLSITCCVGQRENHVVPSAYGDPHLQNIHGKKFDVHDGLHRLVHFPRGSSESEALLKVDADASMMPGETSCYNVFFRSAKLSGKWLGDDVLLQHDNAPMGRKKFVLGMHGNLRDWSAFGKDAANLIFSGTEPVKVSTRIRNASADTPGGDAVEFSIGKQHPVLVQVWASHGSNELTDGKDVQYLNLEVQNLPENTGGLLGLDAYARPARSKCGLTKQETGSLDSMDDLLTSLALARAGERRLQWRISARTREHT